jgi:hypothetical protein
MRPLGEETDVMKTLIAALTLALLASPAFAEAPCQNPSTSRCQKACAIMGAKLALSMREQALATRAQESDGHTFDATVRLTSLRTRDALEGAQRLARLAGFSLQDIDKMTLRDVSAAVVKNCRGRRVERVVRISKAQSAASPLWPPVLDRRMRFALPPYS